MANQRDAGPVGDDVVAAGEPVVLRGSRLEQCELEQRASERHRCALDRRRYREGFLRGITRAAQIMEGKLDIRVVDRPLVNLAVLLEEGGSGGLGLPQHSADRPLEGTTLDRALDLDKEAEL